MSLERGTRPGGPRTDEPTDSGMRIAVAAVLVAVALFVAIGLGLGVLVPGSGSSPAPLASASPSAEPSNPEPTELETPEPTELETPEPTELETPEPTPAATNRPTRTPSPRPTDAPDATAVSGDPGDLPRFPGSSLVDVRQGQGGGLSTLELRYQAPGALDRVRRHYRTMLRRHGWFVGDVEFRDDRWEIKANRGPREAAIELRRDDPGTEVRIEISWPSTGQGGGSGGSDDDHSGRGGG